ncbi:uncharacterized protein LOC120935538 [Rana temporaria]|uniref:uncharacterized protein LOC120935538 n=1 Tax=Rana temporaria TaxID=8407 RepID=UPI001AAD89CA|nr:uncharacterized protein LOC120935538 [Rana temporaria]
MENRSSVVTQEKEGYIDNTCIVSNTLQDVALWLTETVVLKTLEKLNTNKSPGLDGLHSRVLKDLSQVIARQLFLIFLDSILTGMVPADCRKPNIMVRIFKRRQSHIPENYRPVSLTSIVCKLSKAGMIRDYFQEFADEHSIISKNYHGFMKGYSCQTNLLTFYEEVSCHLDKGRLLDVAYLDFTKAFKTVPHTFLIYKLRSVGIDQGSPNCGPPAVAEQHIP